jgi:6-pyruvoyltetrahydropterin/6-carboxytetrahydropterin synthase
MVIDFSRLKSCLNKILMHLDHKVLNNTQYFRKVNPTSENIARYIYDKLNIALGALNFKQLVVTVWETDTSFAAYSETR